MLKLVKQTVAEASRLLKAKCKVWLTTGIVYQNQEKCGYYF